jgi:carbonic anhydrase
MTNLLKFIAAFAIGAAALTGCSSHPVETHAESATLDKATQQAMTPEMAMSRLMQGNQRFVEGTSLRRDFVEQRHATAEHQYPFAIVLACIDSRSGPEIVFDQGIGDLFVPRVAGNYATPDILGSMEYSAKVAGAKLIVVLGHTECGAVKGACDNVEMGNLTTVVQAIRPAVQQVTDPTTDRTSKNHEFVREVAEQNVRLTVQKIRRDSPILREMEEAHQIRIVGAMYDIGTGRVTLLSEGMAREW